MVLADLPTGTTREEAAERRRQRRRVYISSFVGSAVEFYDFLIYATAASLVFGPLFFSSASPAIGTVASFATLAVGYVARPLGGLVAGHFGDRVSRKSTLIWTLTTMGLATALIGVLPTYQQIGALAPILLILLRLVQGIAVGGEWAGAVLMSVEHAKPQSRGLLGSATQSGSAAGLLLSFAAFAGLNGLSQEQFLAWGWRLPFLSTVVLLGIGLYMRLKVQESPVLVAEQAAESADEHRPARAPLFALLRQRPGRVLLAIGVDAGPFMAQAIITTFLISYAVSTYGVDRQVLLTALIIASAIMLFSIPLFALLSDRIGRRPVLITAGLLTAVHAFVVFPMIESGSAGMVLLAFVIALPVLRAATIGPVGALLSELFPTRSRYTGVSLAYQFAAVLGGGIGPLLAASFVTPGGPGIVAVSVLIAGACLVSAACVSAIGETKQVDLTNA
ncbi:MFS transporter [Blastococcus sp. SYSU D00669]